MARDNFDCRTECSGSVPGTNLQCGKLAIKLLKLLTAGSQGVVPQLRGVSPTLSSMGTSRHDHKLCPALEDREGGHSGDSYCTELAKESMVFGYGQDSPWAIQTSLKVQCSTLLHGC